MTKSLEESGFGETYENLVSRLRQDCSRRQRSVTLRSASGHSSSAWPTASASYLNGDDIDLFRKRVARLKEKHKGRTGNGAGMTLATDAENWPAPAARDYKGANGPEHLKKSSGSLHLDQLPNFVEHIFSHRVRQISTDGEASSLKRRTLNPLFVEWLMGWPPGWTLLAWTDFGCSATALSRFKQRMRSALSQLALPAEAPPVQLALFQ